MKRLRLVLHGLAAIVLVALSACTVMPAPTEPLRVKVLAFNDFHGQLESPGRFGLQAGQAGQVQAPVVGGIDALAAHLRAARAGSHHSVVVGAGDLVGATPLISALFLDEPTVQALGMAGLAFSAVGNHEFDKGAAELLRLQNGGCRQDEPMQLARSCADGPFNGASFRWLAANVRDVRTGRPLLPAYGVRHFDQVPVAFIGLTLRGTASIVMPSGIAGWRFDDEAATINAQVGELRSQGVEAIVVLIHEGGQQTGVLRDINGCEGGLAGSPIAAIVTQLDDAVDLVVSGHTHAAYVCRLPNAVGRLVPVTSAAAQGRVFSDIDLVIDRIRRDVREVTAVNRLVSRESPDIPPDAQLGALVQRYRERVGPVASRVIGSIATDLPSVPVDAACNVPAAELVADAQWAATRAPDTGGAMMAFMNRGGVRQPGFVWAQSGSEGDGNLTYAEAFAAQPFGNSLITLTLTAAQIRDLLEEQFAGCRGQSYNTTRVLVPSAGVRYTWEGSRACGERIRNLSLTYEGRTELIVDAQGQVPHPQRPYRVTVNNYLAAGGDGFSTLLEGRDSVAGPSDLDALAAYLAQYRAPNAPYARDLSAGLRLNRSGGGTQCPIGGRTDP